MTDDVRTIDAERAEELMDVLGQVGGGVAVGRSRGTAPAAQINGDHGEAVCQPRHEPPPLEPVLRETVQEHQSGTTAPTDVVDAGAVRGRCLGDEITTQLRDFGLAAAISTMIFFMVAMLSLANLKIARVNKDIK